MLLKREQRKEKLLKTEQGDSKISPYYIMKVKIKLNAIEKVKDFVNITGRQEFNVFIQSGRYIIDAKSIMGIFSVDLCNDLELSAEKCTQEEFDKYCKAIKEFIVE